MHPTVQYEITKARIADRQRQAEGPRSLGPPAMAAALTPQRLHTDCG